MKTLVALAFSTWIAVAAASAYPLVDAEIKAVDAHIAQLQQEFARTPVAPNEKEWVKAKLSHMVEVDQYVRLKTVNSPPSNFEEDDRTEFSRLIAERMGKVDRQNTDDLKSLLRIYPWFTISEFGTEASQNAWLLVQHADHDVEFQKQVLATLEPLAAKGETNPKNYAYLYDRVASSFQNPANRKPQRYGTQGTCTGPGTWEPLAVEDPEKLDERRASVGLPPEAEYKKAFVNVCHESMDESIRKATEAAKARLHTSGS